jgi:hypothetical protein
MATTLIAGSTGAITAEFGATADRLPVTLLAVGLAGAEVATIKHSGDDGTTFTTTYQEGSVVELTATNNVLALHAPGHYRIDKGTTAGAAAIYLSEKVRK